MSICVRYLIIVQSLLNKYYLYLISATITTTITAEIQSAEESKSFRNRCPRRSGAKKKEKEKEKQKGEREIPWKSLFKRRKASGGTSDEQPAREIRKKTEEKEETPSVLKTACWRIKGRARSDEKSDGLKKPKGENRKGEGGEGGGRRGRFQSKSL